MDNGQYFFVQLHQYLKITNISCEHRAMAYQCKRLGIKSTYQYIWMLLFFFCCFSANIELLALNNKLYTVQVEQTTQYCDNHVVTLQYDQQFKTIGSNATKVGFRLQKQLKYSPTVLPFFELNASLPPEEPNIIIQKDIDHCNNLATLEVLVNGVIANITAYQWFKDDSPIVGATFASILVDMEGNYKVDITFDNLCGVASAVYNTQTQVNFIPSVHFSDVLIFYDDCGLGTVTLTLVGTEGVEPYQYSIGGGVYQDSDTFTNIEDGDTYEIYIRDSLECLYNEAIEILASLPIVVENISTTKTNCGESNGTMVFGFSGGTGQIMVSLDNGTTSVSDSVFQDLPAGNYPVVISDQSTCRIDTLIEVPSEDCTILVPNAISPNQDAWNDELKLVVKEGISAFVQQFQVYDRWGNLVYEAQNFVADENGAWWDGTVQNRPAELGVYVYRATVEFGGGSIKNIGGHVMVVK
ncbi:MAG: gliding motility-associated C-terminal domain-containing protein [Chitinophagales bacterium]